MISLHTVIRHTLRLFLAIVSPDLQIALRGHSIRSFISIGLRSWTR